MSRNCLILMLSFAMFVSSATQVFVPQGLLEVVGTDFLGLINNIAFSGAYLVIAISFSLGSIKEMPSSAAFVAMGTILIVQAAFLLQSISAFQLPSVLCIGMYVLNGCAYAVLFSFWIGIAYRMRRRDYGLVVFGGSIISSLSIIVLNAIELYLIVSISRCLLIIASGVFLLIYLFYARNSLNETTVIFRSKTHIAAGKQLSVLRDLSVFSICTCIVGFCYQFSWTTFGPDNISTFCYATGEAFAVLILVLFLLMESVSFLTTWRLLIIFAGAAALSLFVVGFSLDSLQFFNVFLLSTLYNFCLILLMPVCAFMSKKMQISSIGIYATIAFIVNFFTVVGRLTSSVASDQKIVLASLIVVVLFIIGLICIFFIGSSELLPSVVANLFKANDLEDGDTEDSDKNMFPHEIAAREMAADFGCTSKEQEVITCILKGWNVSLISQELIISQNTVKTHLRRIYQKVGVHSRQELLVVSERYFPKKK